MTIATIGLLIAFALVLAAIAIVAMAGSGWAGLKRHSAQRERSGYSHYDDHDDDSWSLGDMFSGGDDDGGGFDGGCDD